MRKYVTAALAVITLSVISDLPFVRGQGTRRDPPAAQQRSALKKPVDPEDGWRQAQRSIEAAIQQLEAYLKANPYGERAESARQQLQVLKSLSLSAARPEWARLHNAAGVASNWRAASVDPRDDKTVVTLEITCPSDFNGECGFFDFHRRPLVLIDQSGRYYPQLAVSPAPQDVRLVNDYPASQYRFQPGRVISFVVDFAPLESGVVSGHVRYRDSDVSLSLVEPAKFSLARRTSK